MTSTERNQLVKELILGRRGIKRRNNAPFPQANSVEKLLRVIELTKKGITTKKEIQEKMSDIHKRQVDYYINAAIYLGALKEGKNRYILHSKFKKEDEKKLLLEFMMQNHIVREVIALYFIDRILPSEMEIARILNKYGSYLENSTLSRRIKTVESWVKWILNKK